MKIGIIGAGHLGQAAARLFAEAGHEVALSNSREPGTLRALAKQLGPRVRAMSTEGAARFGTLVMEAIPFGQIRTLPPEGLARKVFISASNYYPERDGEVDFLEASSGRLLTHTELVARHLKHSRVVKAFNTIYHEHLAAQAALGKPLEERHYIPLASDDADAKTIVARLIEEIGFAPLDLGLLRRGGQQMEPGQPFYNRDWTLHEAKRHLEAPPPAPAA